MSNDIERFGRFIPSEILSDAAVLKILQENQVILSRYRMPDSFKSKLKQMAETTHTNNQGFMKFVKGLGFVIKKINIRYKSMQLLHRLVLKSTNCCGISDDILHASIFYCI